MKLRIAVLLLVCCVVLLFCESCGKDEETEVVPKYGLQKTEEKKAPRIPTEMEKSTKIVYESTLRGSYDIFVINADGTNSKQLTRNSSRNRFPSWSPDGSKIVFVSNRRKRNNFDIYIMNADGTNQEKISGIPGWSGRPDWSPDGSKIIFNTGYTVNFEIFIMNIDGSDPVNLTKHPSWNNSPCWSPDGTKIAFVSDRDGNRDIYVMNADGSNQVNMTNHESKDISPCWSPDGMKIAFVSTRDHVFEKIVEEPDVGKIGLSPEYFEKVVQARKKHDVFIMNADGSNPVNLTKYPNNDFKPTWSPDGSRIAFISIRDGKREIFSMASDGSDVAQITDNDAMDEYPDWGPMIK